MFVGSPQKYWDVHDTRLQSSCSPSPCTTQIRTGSVAAGLEIILNPIFFMQLPTPGQHPKYSSDKRRFRGSMKAEIRRFFAKKHTSAPHFPAWGCRFNRRLTESFRGLARFLISNSARSGIAHQVASPLEARDAISCEREPRFSRWTIVLQLPKMFPLLRGQ